jgi:hypothetical protein
MMRFPGRLALVQRVLPAYRAPFFDLLASACDGGLSLFTGLPRAEEGIVVTDKLQAARYKTGVNIICFMEVSICVINVGLWIGCMNKTLTR